jgi:glycosyltransferase involved in cell wall biosynthesis
VKEWVTGVLRIAYTTIYDATTTLTGYSSYNSMAFHLGRALSRAGALMDYVGPLRETFGPYYWLKQSFHQRFTGKTYNRHRELLPLHDFARQISSHLQSHECDVVFSPLSVGSQPVAYLKTQKPIVICSDSPLACAVANYPALSWNAAARSNLRAGLKNERAALTRADLILYPSSWAANAAIREYSLDPRKVRIIPWGANLETNRTAGDVQRLIRSRDSSMLRILFVGMDWERKGGRIVLETVQQLHRQGTQVHLDIVGCDPFNNSVEQAPDFVTVHGRLRRSAPEERAKFEELFSQSHLLMMPSQGEAFGHVFAEASSYGVPSIATNVDGIPAAVRDGKNGLLFALETRPADYAAAIADLMESPEGYRRLAISSFEEYRRSLNWDSVAQQMLELLVDLVGAPASAPRTTPKAA